MVDINEFCNRLIDDFTAYFREKLSLNLLTQDKISCKAIIKACIEIEPDYVLEIGTNYGLSTLSLAYALKLLGKPLSVLTTTDIVHHHWTKETPIVQRGLLLNSNININEIQTVRQDFKVLLPQDLIKPGKVLVFYDIHDTVTVSYMEEFIHKWIPLFDYGYVMVHDCYIPPSCHWMDRNNPVYPVTSATHFSGITFEGYKECKMLIDWFNATGRFIHPIPGTSILKFAI
jgi:hypothetical protein